MARLRPARKSETTNMATDNPPSLRVPAPHRWQKFIGEAFLVAAIVLGIHLWQVRNLPEGMAPDIAAPTADEQYVSLAEFRSRNAGRVIGLHFWADWCPVCRVEEGNISALMADWPVLTIAMQSGNASAIRRVLAERRLAWPTLIDEDGRLSARYGLTSVPAFVVIDAQGRIRFAEVGYTSRIGMRWRLWWATRFP